MTIRYAANLTMMFTEWEFLDRFAAAADHGFDAVEYLFPYDHPPEVIARALSRNRLTQALFNFPPGVWERGDRGLAALPQRQEDFRQSVSTAVTYAAATGVGRLHLMSGIAPDDALHASAYRDAITYACDAFAETSVNILLEPINSRDMPGYFMNGFPKAETLIRELARPNLKLQFDIYHRQILHGDVSVALERLLAITDHIQIASVPGRNEPNSGELNDSFILKKLDALGYQGFVGCEYRPKSDTVGGLAWRDSSR